MDNYFYSYAVLVYFEETELPETERGRYYVVKKKLNNYEFFLQYYNKYTPQMYQAS